MAYEQFFQYKEAVEKDLKFDEFNLIEVSKRLPSLKHFWVGRLIEAKIELKKLEELKRKAIEQVHSKQKPAIGLSQASVGKMLDKNETVQKINDRIEEWKLIIEYLEKVEKIFSQSGYDIKNFIDVLKMEQS